MVLLVTFSEVHRMNILHQLTIMSLILPLISPFIYTYNKKLHICPYIHAHRVHTLLCLLSRGWLTQCWRQPPPGYSAMATWCSALTHRQVENFGQKRITAVPCYNTVLKNVISSGNLEPTGTIHVKHLLT